MSIIQRIAEANTAHEINLRADQFATAARILMLARGSGTGAEHIATEMGAPAVVRRVLKEAVSGMATTDNDGALADYRNLTTGFSAALANYGVFDAMLSDMLPGALHSRFGYAISNATGYAVDELAPKPVTMMTFLAGLLSARTVAGMIALSNELLRLSSTADALVRRSLSVALANATDAVFLSTIATGVTQVPATGQDAPGILSDLSSAVASLPLDRESKLHIVVSPATARRLIFTPATDGGQASIQMQPSGGLISGVPVHVSDQLTTTALLIDAAAIVAASTEIMLNAGESASLDMQDTPGGSPASTQLVNMFQTNSVALRAVRRFGFVTMRDCAVEITGANIWGTSGSPPA